MIPDTGCRGSASIGVFLCATLLPHCARELAGIALAELFRVQVDFREQAAKSADKEFVLDVIKAFLQGMQQLLILRARHFRDCCPEVLRLDHIMRLEPHLLFKISNIVWVGVIPALQRRGVGLTLLVRIIRSRFFPGSDLVVVRQVAQEQERQHVIVEVIRVHCAAQLVGNASEGRAQLFLVLFGHELLIFRSGTCRARPVDATRQRIHAAVGHPEQ